MSKAKILTFASSVCLLLFLIQILTKEKSDLPYEEKAYIESVLSELSREERKNLHYVFERLLFFDLFSYPLFGTKPMSIGRLLPTQETNQGWQTWKKIAPYFESDKFVIREYMFDGIQFALVANMDEIEKVYYKNKMLFEQVFNGRMNLEVLKNSIKETNPLFQELIHNHLIAGILLGYGTRNAQLFSVNQTLPDDERYPLEFFTTTHPIFYYFSRVLPLYFVCDPNSDETKEIRNRYSAERQAIIKMAKKEDLFIRMLARLHKKSAGNF